MTDLRTRIAAALLGDHCVQGMTAPCDDCQAHALRQADAVIRELDGQLIDFALWLSEELRGEPLSRIDAESCLQEWKWLNDESRWLKDGD